MYTVIYTVGNKYSILLFSQTGKHRPVQNSIMTVQIS
jgi:hypothetical protein